MKEKGQDVRGMLLAFELVTPIVTLSSLFDPSLLPHLFFFLFPPRSPNTLWNQGSWGKAPCPRGDQTPMLDITKGGGRFQRVLLWPA